MAGINDFLTGQGAYKPAPLKSSWTSLTDLFSTPVDSKMVDAKAQAAAVASGQGLGTIRVSDDGSFTVLSNTGQIWNPRMMGPEYRDVVAKAINALQAGNAGSSPIPITYANSPKTAQDAFNLANGIGDGQFAFKTGSAADRAADKAAAPSKALGAARTSTRDVAQFSFEAQDGGEGLSIEDSSDPAKAKRKLKAGRNAFFTGSDNGSTT